MNRHFITVVLVCIGLSAYSQEVHLPEARKIDSLPGRIRNIIIDSLNQRHQTLVMPALPGSRALQQIAGLKNLQQLKDTARQGFLQYLNQSDASSQLKQYRKSLEGLKDSTAIAKFADKKLRAFYALIPPEASQLRLPSNVKNNFKGASAAASYSDSSGAVAGLWNNVSLMDQVSLGSIPFDLNYSNIAQQPAPGERIDNNNLVKMAFNKEAYMQKLNKHLRSNYDLKKYFLQDVNYKALAKDLAEERMMAFRKQSGILLEQMKNRISADELFSFDSLQLKNAVLPDISEDEIAMVRKALSGMEPEMLAEDSSAQQLSQLIQRYDAAQQYYRQLIALKKELGGGQDVLKMANRENTVERGVSRYLDDAGNTSKLSRQLLPMGFLQKLMLGMKNLNLGNFSTSASKGTVSDLFMTGIAGSFMKNNNFAMLGLGKRNDLGMQYSGLESSLSTHAYAMQFIRLGKGDMDKAHTHVTAVNANAKGTSRANVLSGALARNTFLGALSKQLDFGEYGRLNVELSKSNNRFANSIASGQQDIVGVPKAAIAEFMDDFWTTLSTRVSYSGNIKRIGLTHGAYINYSGLGYNNPVNPYAGRGSLQYGLDLKRSWWKNKAFIRFKSNVRNMAQSPLTDNKWKNYQFSLDGHYKLSRRLAFDLRLNQASMMEKRDGHSTPVFMSRKIAAIMQSNGRLGTLPYSASAMMGLQQMDYMQGTGLTKSTFVNLNLMKSVFIGERSLSWSLMYNKDIRNESVYGNILSSDLSYGYVLLKSFTASSGLTFLDSDQMARQVGLRQSLGVQVLKRCMVNLFVDARKDLFKAAEYYYYDNFRMELSIYYLLN